MIEKKRYKGKVIDKNVYEILQRTDPNDFITPKYIVVDVVKYQIKTDFGETIKAETYDNKLEIGDTIEICEISKKFLGIPLSTKRTIICGEREIPFY